MNYKTFSCGIIAAILLVVTCILFWAINNVLSNVEGELMELPLLFALLISVFCNVAMAVRFLEEGLKD